MIKIAFFDVDGTILRFAHKNLTDKMTYTLNKLHENGVLLCLATGRGYCGLPRFDKVNFDVYLTFNGSYIRNDKEIINSIPLNKNDVKAIINNLKEMNRPLAIANEKMIICNGYEDNLSEYFALGSNKLIVSDEFDSIASKDIYQIMCGATKDEFDSILKGCTSTKITAWWPKAVDIVPSNSGKGIGVNAVLNYYGFSNDEAIAFGDGSNDIDMLEAVKYGIAMGNASEEVKKHAFDVCDTCDNDGIYKYCINKGLINYDHVF